MYFFASDYDGTLYRNESISQFDREMIELFRAQGHQFGIATGRHLNSILTELDRFNLGVDFTIGNNGSAVLDRNREEVYLAEIEKTLVTEVYDYVRRNMRDDFYFFAINNGYHYGSDYFHENKVNFTSEDEISLSEVLASERICALFGEILPGKSSLQLSQRLNTVFNGRVQACPNGEFIDVVLPNNNKASGIQRVVQTLRTPVERIFTVGDSFNDIEMLQTYGGFVMASGEQSIQSLSVQVVDSVGEALSIILGSSC